MIPLLVKIDRKIKHDDEFDAIAIGITCLNSRPA
jgi:Holliday junction resolvasome RuvABC endonuclease subunit